MDREKIGFDSCLKALGEEFAAKNKDRMVFSCGETEKGLFCFLGVSTHDYEVEKLCLKSNVDDWEYYASCYVVDEQKIVMDKCNLPSFVN